MRLCTILSSLSPAVLLPTVLAAQQPQPVLPMVAASYYECTAAPTEIDVLLKAAWQPVMEQQTREGKVINWGILRHAWADEWNLVLYRTVADLRALQASQDVLTPALNQRDPEYATKLARMCPRHKDNIYWAVAGGPPASPGPRGGGSPR